MNPKVKTTLEQIFRAGLRAVDPQTAVHRHVQRSGKALMVADQVYPLEQYRRVVVVGAGKATAPMAQALEDLLGEDLDDGTIVVKYDHGLPLAKISVAEAGHPIPDRAGVAGTVAIRSKLEPLAGNDLAICAISGGGSALMPLPVEPVSLEQKQEVTRQLLACGASIDEINCIRKHLSRIKGGRLAEAAYPARLITLILSDVVGDPLDVIASGPCAPDPSTFADCLAVLDKYELRGKLPRCAERYLVDGASGRHPETPTADSPVFSRVHHVLVGNNRTALQAAADSARGLGYRPLILTSSMAGEAREVARMVAAIGKEISGSGQPVRPPACVLIGGETTVTLRGQGRGGRNQEFALAAALALAGIDGIAILSAGTDGTDGPTDAAGAFADGATTTRARARGLNPQLCLRENNAYPLFEQLGDLFAPGPTRTNVMDMVCMIIE